MTLQRFIAGHIGGTGLALPKRARFDNAAVMAKLSPTGRRGPRSAEEIAEVAQALAESLGVSERAWAHVVGDAFAADEETSVDLQAAAVHNALDAAGIDAAQLGGILLATSTPAHLTGANAPKVATKLGYGGMAYDIRCGCAGGLYALVQGFVWSEVLGAPVAVAGGDTFSKIVPPDQPLAALAFGDGAGAAVIVPGSPTAHGAAGAGLLAATLHVDGSLGHLGTTPGRFPPTPAAVERGEYFLAGDPDQMAREAVPRYVGAIGTCLEAAGLQPADVVRFVPHQPGSGLLRAVQEGAGLLAVPMTNVVARFANTGAGSVLMALHVTLTEAAEPVAGPVLLASLGGGLGWGAAVVRF